MASGLMKVGKVKADDKPDLNISVSANYGQTLSLGI